MLSILIPIYAYNVLPLVTELQKQCEKELLEYEILCQDDASFSECNIENERINLLPNCSFVALSKNVAHRENRNKLAEQAKYEYLLFVDGDSICSSPTYIQKFISSINNFDVVYGGRLHPSTCPSDKQKLRWKYGFYIEDQLADARKKRPYSSLLFNNTLIKKECFNQIKFDRNMKKYGHDDTQLAFELNLLQASVLHIDNQIEHGAIDTNSIYLNKTKESLENILQLYDEQKISISFLRIVTLLDFLKRSKLFYPISILYVFFEKQLYKNLVGNHPNLLFFTAFRVGYLCQLLRKK